jgi:uncharacterized protein with GYD domain
VARYVISASYVAEHWDRLIAHPKASVAGFRQIVQTMGATLESFDYIFGEHDLLAVIDAPDATTQVAVSVALASTNVFRAVDTRELIDPQVVVAALNAIGAARAAADNSG